MEIEFGSVCNRLTVLSFSHKNNGTNYYVCQCDCGNIKTVDVYRLVHGHTKSCGCLKSEKMAERNYRHGMSKTKEYSCFKAMNSRCNNPNNEKYPIYSKLDNSDEILSSFEVFIEEIGPYPSDGLSYSIGRIDNNIGYTFGNIRWETAEQQARNHSMQTNNLSGFVGVSLCNGKRWVATWKLPSGKQGSKSFSIQKFGFANSKALAVAYREKEFNKLKMFGIEYAESHGMKRESNG